jgi:quercetin dioxygenase-like cupin family protein
MSEEPIRRVQTAREPGDIVAVPSGTRHIHGARPGASATHVAVTGGETVWDSDPRYPGA